MESSPASASASTFSRPLILQLITARRLRPEVRPDVTTGGLRVRARAAKSVRAGSRLLPNEREDALRTFRRVVYALNRQQGGVLSERDVVGELLSTRSFRPPTRGERPTTRPKWLAGSVISEQRCSAESGADEHRDATTAAAEITSSRTSPSGAAQRASFRSLMPAFPWTREGVMRLLLMTRSSAVRPPRRRGTRTQQGTPLQ